MVRFRWAGDHLRPVGPAFGPRLTLVPSCSRSRPFLQLSSVTASTDFKPFQPAEREAIRQQEGDKARSEDLVERLRTLGRQLAHETETNSNDGSVAFARFHVRIHERAAS